MPNIAKSLKMVLVIFNFAQAISAALRNGYRAPKISKRIRADRLNELTAEFRGLQNLSDDVFQFTGNQPVTHDMTVSKCVL